MVVAGDMSGGAGGGEGSSRKRTHSFDEAEESPRNFRTRQRRREDNGDTNFKMFESNGGSNSGQQRRMNLAPLAVPNRNLAPAVPLQNGAVEVDATEMFVGGAGDEGGVGLDDDEQRGCRCGKSKCLKQYCQCFRKDVRCGLDCMCTDCHNDGNHEKQRVNAIRRIRRNNTSAFRGTALEVTETEVRTPGGTVMNARGCRCKRSRCQKKYCECYGAGFACTANCVCTDCENGNILSPRAEDLILKPSLAKALPAHAPSTVMPARQPDYGEMRAEQLCMRQQSQQQAVAHSHYMMHQQQLQAQQQHYAHQQQVLATRGGTTSSMPAPKNTPINLYSKKRPNMYVQVPNPSQAPEGGFASTSAGQSTGHETPGMYELNRGPSGLQSATQRGSMNWGGGTPKGGYTPQGTAPSFPQFFGRQDSSLWYQDVYTSGGGICSDGSLSGLLGSPKTPRTRRQATLERAGSNDNLSSLGGLWSASGAGPSSASVRRSARVATFDGGLHRNTPPVSPIVADHFWATSADADMGLADPDNILTEPMSARAWVAHMPGPQRENSGLSQSGR